MWLHKWSPTSLPPWLYFHRQVLMQFQVCRRIGCQDTPMWRCIRWKGSERDHHQKNKKVNLKKNERILGLTRASYSTWASISCDIATQVVWRIIKIITRPSQCETAEAATRIAKPWSTRKRDFFIRFGFSLRKTGVWDQPKLESYRIRIDESHIINRSVNESIEHEEVGKQDRLMRSLLKNA